MKANLKKRKLSKLINAAKIEKAKRVKARRHIFDFIKYTFQAYKNENWHHKVISEFVQAVVEKRVARGMIFAPPRHMKTETMQRSFSYAFGDNHDLKLILTAYGADKAYKISNHIKSNVTDSAFKSIFPKFPGIQGVNQLKNWTLGGKHRGEVLAAGVGGPITGEGFHIGYIDDPVKSRAEAESATYQNNVYDWYKDTFLTRQDEADSGVLITNTRWNRKDLCGRLLADQGIALYNNQIPAKGCPEWNGDPAGEWHVLCLPAIMDEEAFAWKHPEDPRKIGSALWPQRFPLEFLEQFQKNKYNWASAYQQRPQPKGGNLINRTWFEIVDEVPVGARFVRFWDLAGTPKQKSKKNDPDFTAGALVGFKDNVLYIADIKTARDTPLNIEKMIKQNARLDDNQYDKVRQYWEEEGGAGGKHISDHYRKLLAAHWRQAYRVGKKKEFYIDLMANKAEAGEIKLVQGKWLTEVHDGNTFLDEAEEFPKGRHDDRIDAVAKACYILSGAPLTMGEALKIAKDRGDKQMDKSNPFYKRLYK